MNAILPALILATVESLVFPTISSPSNYYYVAIPTDTLVKAEYVPTQLPEAGLFFPCFTEYIPNFIVKGANAAIVPCIHGKNFFGDHVRPEDILWIDEALQERKHVVERTQGVYPVSSPTFATLRNQMNTLYAPTGTNFHFMASPPTMSKNDIIDEEDSLDLFHKVSNANFADAIANLVPSNPIPAHRPVLLSDIYATVFRYLNATAGTNWVTPHGGYIMGNYTVSGKDVDASANVRCTVSYANHVATASFVNDEAEYVPYEWGTCTMAASSMKPTIEYNFSKKKCVWGYLADWRSDNPADPNSPQYYHNEGHTDVQTWTRYDTKETITNPKFYISSAFTTNCVCPDGFMRVLPKAWVACSFICRRFVEIWSEEGLVAEYPEEKYVALIYNIESPEVMGYTVSSTVEGNYPPYGAPYTYNQTCKLDDGSLNFYQNEYEAAFYLAFEVPYGTQSYSNLPSDPPAPTYAELAAFGRNPQTGLPQLDIDMIHSYEYRETQQVLLNGFEVMPSVTFKYNTR